MIISMFGRFAQPNSGVSNPTPTAASSFGSSIFGAPQGSQQPSAFGGFGITSSNTPTTSLAAPSVPYSITNEYENNVNIKLLAISAMPAYLNRSFEEIRVEDYARGRKGRQSFPTSSNLTGGFASTSAAPSTGMFGSSQPSAFGTGSTFGAPSSVTEFNSSNANAFGTNNAFGAGTSSAFGSNTGSTGFGGSTGTSGFGSNAGTSAFGAGSSGFNTGTGGFGASPASAASSSPFGGSSFNTTPAPFGSSSSTFGTNAFGSNTSGFGSTQPTTATTSTFGSTQPTTSTGFGQFGGSGTSAFGATKPFGSGTGFGAFGSTPATSTTTPPTNNFGVTGFGAQGNTGTTSQFGSTFGSSTSAPFQSLGNQSNTTSAFSQPQQQQQQSASNQSLFPSSSFGTTQQNNSLFGSTQPANNLGSSSLTSSFAPKPASSSFGSLFPSSTGQGGQSGAFGSAAPFSLNRSSTLPSSTTPLFSSGASSNTTQQPQQSSINSFFGTSRPSGTSTTNAFTLPSTSSMTQQPSSTSTAPIFTSNLPIVSPASYASSSLAPPLPAIFSSAPIKPSESTLNAEATKSPVKFTPRTTFRLKPRNVTAPVPFNLPGAMNNDAHPTSGLVPRKNNLQVNSLKKLIVADLDDFKEQAENKPQALNTSSSYHQPSQPALNAASNLLATASTSLLTANLSFGQLYMFPSEASLKEMSLAERSHIRNFVIGQKGVGQIRFLAPVDLSACEVDCIFGNLVQFVDGEAVLYPDPSIPKPAPGKGLNVPAEVRLERIWTFSRGSREPIIDSTSEKVQLFIEKLKETEGTNFVSYDAGTGTWTFTVGQF